MATAEGFVRRITRRLTEDPQQRDAQELTGEADSTGAQRAVDCQRGQEVTMVGTLRSVETNAKGCAGGVRAEFFDGTDSVTLVWLGQRRIRRTQGALLGQKNTLSQLRSVRARSADFSAVRQFEAGRQTAK